MDWLEFSPWARPLLAALLAIVLGVVVHRVGRVIVLRLVHYSVMLDNIAHRIDRPAQLALPLLGLQFVWQGAPDDLHFISALRHLNALVLIAAITWLLVEVLRGISKGVLALHPADVADNLGARRVHTQTRVLVRTGMGITILAGISFMLMTFPGARQLGASLLASAGVFGLVAGIAARSLFSNLIAGLQIALGQPLRIDDVLVVQGEWGRVEEITRTYVVLRIWDERRLIIPLQWLIENPFQNWTRRSANILGSVMLWVDYTLPLDALRAEAQRLCEASPDWDGRLCLLQVVETSERAMQLRVLVSSASSGQNWDLRCTVREGLIALIVRDHPQALPRLRAELDSRSQPNA